MLFTRGACFALIFAFIAVIFADNADARRKRRGSKKMRKRAVTRVHYDSVHKMAGCGLGTMVFTEGDKWSQVGAAFLNGTGMQTFAMTFGTSNCTEDGLVEDEMAKRAFVESNLADLSHDIALGEGEYIAALADIYGCQADAQNVFVQEVHKNYGKILLAGPNTDGVITVIDDIVATQVSGCQGS